MRKRDLEWKPDDAGMMASPERWPYWPYLPLKRYNKTTHQHDIGTLCADARDGAPMTFFENVMLPMVLTGEVKLQKQQGTKKTPAALVAEGWIVD